MGSADLVPFDNTPVIIPRSEFTGTAFVDGDNGLEPTEEGLFRVSWEDYLNIRALNSGSLDALTQSPLHLKTLQEQPPKPSSPVFKKGTAFHTAILEPERFDATVITDLDINHNKTVYKQWRAHQEGVDRTILKAKDINDVKRMAAKVRQKTSVTPYLESGWAEWTALWKDPEYGFWCKARIDFLPKNFERTIVDVKTTENASQYKFMRSIWNYKYSRQAAWYLMGMTAVSGQLFDKFFWLAWEKEPPYEGNLLEADPEEIERANVDLVVLRETYAKCLETDQWPGYPDRIVRLGQTYEYPVFEEGEDEDVDF